MLIGLALGVNFRLGYKAMSGAGLDEVGESIFLSRS